MLATFQNELSNTLIENLATMKTLFFLLTFTLFGCSSNSQVEEPTIDNTDYVKSGMEFHWDWKLPQAIEEYTKAIEQDEGNCKAYFCRGVAKHDSGDKKGAEKDWIEARIYGCTETAGDFYFDRAVRHYDSGDTTRACEDWHTAEEYGESLATTFIKSKCSK